MGEVKGNNEATIAKVESGTSAVLKLSIYPNNMGSITGVMNCCESCSESTAAPMAAKIELYIKKPSIKNTKKCAQALAKGAKPPIPKASSYRFRYYDLLLLHVLSTNVPDSRKIFRSLFKNSPVDRIFKFLSEETNFIEDLRVLASCYYPPFLRALTVHPPFFTQFDKEYLAMSKQAEIKEDNFEDFGQFEKNPMQDLKAIVQQDHINETVN